MKAKRKRPSLGVDAVEELADFDAGEILPYADQFVVLDVSPKRKTIRIALNSETDERLLHFIQHATGLKPVCVRATTEEFGNLASRQEQSLDHLMRGFSGSPLDPDSSTGVIELHDATTSPPVVSLLRRVFDYAIFRQAHAVHFDNEAHGMRVRFRVHGALHEVMQLPSSAAVLATGALKRFARCHLSRQSLQRGSFRMRLQDSTVDIRLSAYPAADGELLIARLHPHQRHLFLLEQLGMEPQDARMLVDRVRSAPGLTLLVGPEDSGTTTTAYALLASLNTPEVHILTVEDPVEYPLPGINQAEVSSAADMERMIHVALQQDVDILFIGSLNNAETVSAAVSAVLTGHRVIATMQAADTAGAVSQLRSWDIPDDEIAMVVRSIIAQRLVRTPCRYCMASTAIDADGVQRLGTFADEAALSQLLHSEHECSEGCDLSHIVFYRSDGCTHCHYSGFQGRSALFELLPSTNELRSVIEHHGSADEINDVRRRAGSPSLLTQAFLAAKRGKTTLPEVMRLL